MLKLAFYGKGGIGKSTTVSNIAYALAEKGLQVMQIGCDPKADSTMSHLGGRRPTPVLELIRKYGDDFSWQDMVLYGEKNIACVEAGGPVPGMGCAGRGIINALEKLESKGAYSAVKPDVVLYDVLGDVVCGGFAAPIREGYAEKVLIVTSGEKMALYAANNINNAVKNFADRNYAAVRGIVMNRRAVENEEEKVRKFADDNNLEIVADIPRSNDIIHYEDMGKTVIEGNKDLPVSQKFLALAQMLIDEGES